MPPYGVLLEDAADARHDTPYIPPMPCRERINTPRYMCARHGGTVHTCANPRVTHSSVCMCLCQFKWDITATVPTNG